VATILISDPHPDVRSLLSFVVRRLGHEPVGCDTARPELEGIDAIVVEPGDRRSLALARWARQHAPTVPVLCASIYPPSPATDALRPDAYLEKPFPLLELERALTGALAARD
jgi:CheY-like chemotaxis protein